MRYIFHQMIDGPRFSVEFWRGDEAWRRGVERKPAPALEMVRQALLVLLVSAVYMKSNQMKTNFNFYGAAWSEKEVPQKAQTDP